MIKIKRLMMEQKKVINKERAGPHLTKEIQIKKVSYKTVLVKFTALAMYEDSMNCAERSWVQCFYD